MPLPKMARSWATTASNAPRRQSGERRRRHHHPRPQRPGRQYAMARARVEQPAAGQRGQRGPDEVEQVPVAATPRQRADGDPRGDQRAGTPASGRGRERWPEAIRTRRCQAEAEPAPIAASPVQGRSPARQQRRHRLAQRGAARASRAGTGPARTAPRAPARSRVMIAIAFRSARRSAVASAGWRRRRTGPARRPGRRRCREPRA